MASSHNSLYRETRKHTSQWPAPSTIIIHPDPNPDPPVPTQCHSSPNFPASSRTVRGRHVHLPGKLISNGTTALLIANSATHIPATTRNVSAPRVPSVAPITSGITTVMRTVKIYRREAAVLMPVCGTSHGRGPSSAGGGARGACLVCLRLPRGSCVVPAGAYVRFRGGRLDRVLSLLLSLPGVLSLGQTSPLRAKVRGDWP
jgi:hypothetical protein